MYLSLSLKTESCINQRSRGLEVTLATCEVYMASVCLRVQPCTSQPSCDLKGRTGCELHDLDSLQLLLPLPICQHTHTHNCEAWQGVLDKYWPNSRNLKGVKRVKPFLCMRRESIFLREKPSVHLPFPSLKFHW